jgi:hypothetical protein
MPVLIISLKMNICIVNQSFSLYVLTKPNDPLIIKNSNNINKLIITKLSFVKVLFQQHYSTSGGQLSFITSKYCSKIAEPNPAVKRRKCVQFRHQAAQEKFLSFILHH